MGCLIPSVPEKISFNESLLSLRQILASIKSKLEMSHTLSYTLTQQSNAQKSIALIETLMDLPGLKEKQGEILYCEHFIQQLTKIEFIG